MDIAENDSSSTYNKSKHFQNNINNNLHETFCITVIYCKSMEPKWCCIIEIQFEKKNLRSKIR